MKIADDILHRQPFVNEIKKLIVEYTKQDTDGLVIGLEGSWGSGKTSILNLLEQAFTEESDEFVVRRLDSWLAVDSVSLTLEFFKTLREAARDAGTFLDGNDYIKEQLQKAPRFILKGLKASGVSFNLSGISVKPDWNAMLADKTLREKKEEIRQNLKVSQKHIIYMIDDLDRLNSEEVALVMQLVKNLADFPNVIYILAYDRDIVSNALQHIDGRNGADFMEKIVQVPIAMPAFDKDDLLDYFSYQLHEIISTQKIKMDSNLLRHTIQVVAPLYINNIRDCKRILNAFRVRYLVCADYCDVRDLLCIILLELYEPKVVSYIADNISIFCLAGEQDLFLVTKDEFDKSTDNINERSNNIQSVKKIIGVIFPAYAKKVGWIIINDNIIGDDIITNRIAYKENFYAYFILSPNEKIVLSKSIEDMLLYWNEDDIKKQLLKWNKDHRLNYVKEKINAYCEIKNTRIKLNKDRMMTFLHSMIALQDKSLDGYKYYSWISMPWCVVKKAILKPGLLVDEYSIGEEYKDEILSIFHDESISLETLESLMFYIGHGYSWCEQNDGIPFVSESIFKECKYIIIERLNIALKNNHILESVFVDDFVYQLINNLRVDFIRYLGHVLKKDLNPLKHKGYRSFYC